MEESIKDNLTSDIWDVLGLKSVSPRQLSPLVLAYIGDSIFDLVVKTKIVAAGSGSLPVATVSGQGKIPSLYARTASAVCSI